jgi:hypothetical protein
MQLSDLEHLVALADMMLTGAVLACLAKLRSTEGA